MTYNTPLIKDFVIFNTNTPFRTYENIIDNKQNFFYLYINEDFSQNTYVAIDNKQDWIFQNTDIFNRKYSNNHFSNEKLKEIAQLDYNWNNNGANKFNFTLLNKVDKILDNLLIKPLIYPTACNSIQLEYEKDSGEYLEIEIFLDKIKIFSIDCNENEKEYVAENSNTLIKIVETFFEQ